MTKKMRQKWLAVRDVLHHETRPGEWEDRIEHALMADGYIIHPCACEKNQSAMLDYIGEFAIDSLQEGQTLVVAIPVGQSESDVATKLRTRICELNAAAPNPIVLLTNEGEYREFVQLVHV